MPINDVIRACESLANTGKKPTIALVKTRIVGKIPLSLIVKGIQQFQNNYEFSSNVSSKTVAVPQHEDSITTTEDLCKCEDRVRNLENEIAEMKACIKALQVQVKALIVQ